MKILIGTLVFTLTKSSCRAAYIKDRPVDAEIVRLASPGYNYIWLNDNWVYDRRKSFIRGKMEIG